ncbi:MAG: RidA family protein, partial [Desulfuromonadales bacterium]|nr:RidA family protein [Desulfuromonadales bacterium]
MQKIVWTFAIAVGVVGLLAGAVWSQDTVPVKTLPFSAARQAGSTLYVSGQIAVDPDGTPVEGSIAAETRQVMRNISKALERR